MVDDDEKTPETWEEQEREAQDPVTSEIVKKTQAAPENKNLHTDEPEESIFNSPISKMFERQIREKGYIGEPDFSDLEEEPGAGNIYKAHWIKVRTPRLKIRHKGGRRAPAYHDLIDVDTNSAGTKIDVFFDCMIVRIRGRNLLKIADAIEDHVCRLILEFNPQAWGRPAPDAPIIEEISFPVEAQDKGKKALS